MHLYKYKHVFVEQCAVGWATGRRQEGDSAYKRYCHNCIRDVVLPTDAQYASKAVSK